MEITIENHQTGHDILKGIKEQWPDRKAIVQAVKDGSMDAQDVLFWWDLLHKQPRRLDEMHKRSETILLDDDALRFLTRGRREILRHIASHRGESLGDIADHLGKDLGNVQRATQKLADLGFVRLTKRKKETLAEPAGNIIRMDLLA